MLFRSLESPLRSAAVHHFGGCGDGVDLCFDDVIYGFWVYDWVFSRVFDDLWSDWCYVVLLLMLDDLDVLSLIWLSFDLLVFFLNNFWVCVLKSRVCVLVQDTLISQFM